MQIIKTLDCNEPWEFLQPVIPELEDDDEEILDEREYDVARRIIHPTLGKIIIAPEDKYTKIKSPSINPTLINKYLAFNIFPKIVELKIAIIDPETQKYIDFNPSTFEWENSDAPIYYTEIEVNNFIANWYKEIAFEVLIPPQGFLTELKVAFESIVSIEDYILQFALPRFLAKPCTFAYTAQPQNGILTLPDNFNPARINNIEIRRMRTGDFVEDIVLEGMVIYGENINDDFIYLITFNYATPAFFMKGEFQLEELPCVIFQRKQETKFRKGGGFYDSIELNPSEGLDSDILTEQVLMHYNLEIDILFVASELRYAQILYESIMRQLIEKPLKIPPIDEEFAIQWNNAYIRNDTDPAIDSIVNGVDTIKTTCTIFNIPIT